MEVDLTSPLSIARAIGGISGVKAEESTEWNEVDSLVSILEDLLEGEVKQDAGAKRT